MNVDNDNMNTAQEMRDDPNGFVNKVEKLVNEYLSTGVNDKASMKVSATVVMFGLTRALGRAIAILSPTEMGLEQGLVISEHCVRSMAETMWAIIQAKEKNDTRGQDQKEGKPAPE